MAGQTPRFALNFFGGDTPGDFSDDNDKYTSEDRLALDRLLAAFESHTHRVTTTLNTPDDEPGLVLGASGTLEAGTTYFYVISLINADGLETVSGPEVSIDTPALLVPPDAPQGESAILGGALSPGLYYYALTGLRDGEESALGAPTSITLLDGESSVTITLPDLGEADSFQLWRMKETDPGWTRIAISTMTVPPTLDLIVDGGAVPAAIYGDPANIPPTTNSGVDKYSVTITLTGDDVTHVVASQGWRIYRTTVSGTYGATSLVHEVIERTSETDPSAPLLISWIDDGDAPLTGSPRLFSSELNIPPFTFEYFGVQPTNSDYPPNYPILVGDAGNLFINNAGNNTWTQIGGSSGTVRGVATFTGHGFPYAPPATAVNDDIYIDLDTGDVFVFSALSGGGGGGVS